MTISVKQYGAVGDGVTDDSAAIASALREGIDTASPVYFPAGIYLLGSTVLVPAGSFCRIVGDAATIVYSSLAFRAFRFTSSSSNVVIEGLTFQGDINDDKTQNTNLALSFPPNVTDVLIERCTFDHCVVLGFEDSASSARLIFRNNLLRNCTSGISAPNYSTIENNWFICDAVVATRAQAIYLYGQAENCVIRGNYFKNIGEQDIQIRAGAPRYNNKHRFIITNNYFENSHDYSIYVGSDATPDIGGFVITDNVFRNVGSPIFVQGGRDVVISGNLAEWDWEFAGTPSPTAVAIAVDGATSLPAHFNNGRGVVVTNNRLVQRHPWFGKIQIVNIPVDGDTVAVSANQTPSPPYPDFVYTWRTSPTIPRDVLIGASVQQCAQNLVTTIQGRDGLAIEPCNVLRDDTDVFCDTVDTVQNLVVVVSSSFFDIVSTGTTFSTITTPIDNRQSCGVPISVTGVIAPVVSANHIEDFFAPLAFTQNVFPTVRDNTVVIDRLGASAGMVSTANILSWYSGNRVLRKNLWLAPRPWQTLIINDGFPVIDDPLVTDQESSTIWIAGRSGVVKIGDGKAYTLLWYGKEIVGADPTEPQTRLFRWDDGDELYFADASGVNTLTLNFKRTSPGSAEFNSSSDLVAKINSSGIYCAHFVHTVPGTGAPDPELMIKIWNKTAGTSGNDHQLEVRRYPYPGAALVARQTTPQPMLVGVILRDRMLPDDGTRFLAGSAVATDFLSGTKTAVFTPLANPSRGVTVQGIDPFSQSLAPIVYQTDIIPGVGFTITHSAIPKDTSPTASFFFHVH